MTTGGKALGVVFSDQDFENITVSGTATIANQVIESQTVESFDVATSAQIGAASTATVAFFGATVTTQPATIGAVTTAALTSVTTTGSTTSTPFGYTTSTQADAIVTLVNALAVRAAALTTQGNALRDADITLGLVAAS